MVFGYRRLSLRPHVDSFNSPQAIRSRPGPDGARFTVCVSWGDYKRKKSDAGGYVWQRHSREGRVDGIGIASAGKISQIKLSASGASAAGVTVSGIDDPEVTLEGVVHELAQYRAVSLFLVNRRTKVAA